MTRPSRPLRQPSGHSLPSTARGGFTLIEVLIAVSLLGLSLVVMFGFHGQAVRSNMHARKMTDCTYLAQLQLEQLLSLPWTQVSVHADLQDNLSDTTGTGAEWAYLEHPNSAAAPSPVNSASSTDTTLGKPVYYVTWDSEMMNTDETYTLLKVRCQYYDYAFSRWHGTTVSTYRFRDS